MQLKLRRKCLFEKVNMVFLVSFFNRLNGMGNRHPFLEALLN